MHGDAKTLIEALCAYVRELPTVTEQITALNEIRLALHDAGPFANEPVDCVLWELSEHVVANDYNPNTVAPPEMELLRVSIEHDGYTQPIVTMPWDGYREVVDGFHRHRVGREYPAVRERIYGYLPVVSIRSERSDRPNRIAATIRHNRARGKHRVEAMSDIVIELKRRNWSDERIGHELGMDPDEVLRLCQITGLAEVFKDEAFSEAWDIERDLLESDGEIFTDESGEPIEESDRVLHTWEKWECYRHGFFAERPPNKITQEQGEEIYRDFLSDDAAFRAALEIVTTQWKFSCEHNLTNDRMNRVAWLGQAAVCQARGMPSICRAGYHRLSEEQQARADTTALEYLNKWLEVNGRPTVDMTAALGRTEPELY